MLKNYFKVTLRNLVKNKVSTFINLFGLSIGLSACVLAFLVINFELNYDNFHSKGDSIYRVVRDEVSDSGEKRNASTPFPMRSALINDYPELLGVTQVFYPQEYQLQWEEEKWTQNDIIFSDSNFFQVFDFEVVTGNPVASFRKPNTAFITESMAKSHFGGDSPVGKVINFSEIVDVEIAGVLKDAPGNSHLPFSMIVNMESFNDEMVGGFKYDSWGVNIGFAHYVMLPEGMSKADFENQLALLPRKYLKGESAENTHYTLQPLREIHFDKTYAEFNPGYTVDTSYLYVLGFIGLFILLLACINFVNLSTALALRKSREVGVRKVLGATRMQLVYQYLGEAFLLTLLATLVALGVAERVMPFINSLMGTSLGFEALRTPMAIGFLISIIIAVSIMSGLYPALVLSGYNPAVALKGKMTSAAGNSKLLREGLVTFQFVISQVLIIGTIVVAQQMNYFRNKPLGFDKDYIVTAGLSDRDPVKLQTLKTQLLSNSNVKSVSFAIGVPTSDNDINSDIRMDGVEREVVAGIKAIDYDYLKTFDLQIAAGRWFLKQEEQEAGLEFLINETAVREFGFSSPDEALGKNLSFGLSKSKGPIIGVVKDFHTKSLHEAIRPQVMVQYPNFYFEAGIKINDSNIPETIAHIKAAWEQAFPDFIFEYTFMDDYLAKNYSRENQLFTIFKIFSGVSIGIGCLGLFGLISFLIVQKTKEVGVRKVLGASVSGIVMLLSNDFIKLVGIAFLIAAPLVWYSMNQWLSGFAYRIDIDPIYFLVGGILNVAIAFFTISYQAVRAATANPVESLRDE
ncbi:MAG TPA: ABC transporter permease [Cyclobacteriaceae bacterium]|nr:ABC transporter permease [Cyclobacteriaceae bacterium]